MQRARSDGAVAQLLAARTREPQRSIVACRKQPDQLADLH
jgi:hypothetical protein